MRGMVLSAATNTTIAATATKAAIIEPLRLSSLAIEVSRTRRAFSGVGMSSHSSSSHSELRSSSSSSIAGK